VIRKIIQDVLQAEDGKNYSINGEKKCKSDVVKTLSSLRCDHIDYTVEAVRSLTQPPKSFPDYIRAILYNAVGIMPIRRRIRENEMLFINKY
jgi:hypothetical protein